MTYCIFLGKSTNYSSDTKHINLQGTQASTQTMAACLILFRYNQIKVAFMKLHMMPDMKCHVHFNNNSTGQIRQTSYVYHQTFFVWCYL